MKILLFTIIKKDNRWLDGWVKHHLDLGIDNILIYDNNDGREDYPMSDYIIEQCSNKRIKMENHRNKRLCFSDELYKLDCDGYDFVLGLKTNEYLMCNKPLKETLGTTGLKARTYPYIGDKIDYQHLFFYKDIVIKNTHNDIVEQTKSLFFKKITNQINEKP